MVSRLRARRLAFGLIAFLLSSATVPAQDAPAQKATSPWDGEVLQSLLGTWDGTGTVYGNEVSLTRDWSLDLKGHFVRGDMGVQMSNGFGFRALTFWRIESPRHYSVVWMDEVGDFKTFEAVADPESREVVTHYVDRTESGAKEWRRIVYRVIDADHYQETMFRWTGGKWEALAEFRFTRSGGETTPER